MAELRDPHLHISFYMDAIEDHAATRDQGRPIYKDVEMVRIMYVGDNKREHHAPAHERFTLGEDGRHLTYAERFPEHYDAFKRHVQEATVGTPLTEVSFLTKAKVAELKALNITNVEGLAALNQSAIKRLGMGGRDLVDQAKAYIGQAAETAALSKAQAENEELRQRIERLEATMSGGTPEPDAGPDGWSDDELREYLTEQGATPRANASRDKMIAAVREFMELEAA